MIDFHLHFGRMYRDQYPARIPLTPQQLVDHMDRSGIDIGVLLPLESPEGSWGYLLTEEVIAARDLYPERFVAFVSVDPRYPRCEQHLRCFIERYGCRGVGEIVNGLAFDDPLQKVIWRVCDDYGLPVIFEINRDYCFDEPGLPRLEACLREFPNAQFCGHGPGFWSAISGDDDQSGGYPSGPVKPGGALDRLLAEHDNLHADLSAGSGWNGLSRDPGYTAGFVERHWRKLVWGSDYLATDQPVPQLEWVRNLDASAEAREAIADGNARRLLRLD